MDTVAYSDEDELDEGYPLAPDAFLEPAEMAPVPEPDPDFAAVQRRGGIVGTVNNHPTATLALAAGVAAAGVVLTKVVSGRRGRSSPQPPPKPKAVSAAPPRAPLPGKPKRPVARSR